MSRTPHARTWESIIEVIRDRLEDAYENAIVSLAVQQASEAQTRGENVEGTPTYDNMRETFARVLANDSPEWWPASLDRLTVQLHAIDENEAPEILPARPFHPTGNDLGRSQYHALLGNMLRGVGTPFNGIIRVELARARDRTQLGSFRGPVQVGSVKQLQQSDREQEMSFLIDHMHKINTDYRLMFQQSAAVIHAGAAMVNASRGVNPGAPWMADGQQPEDSGMPQWMSLGLEALGYAFGDKSPQAPQQQRPQGMYAQPQLQGPQYGQPQLPGPVDLVGAPPPNQPLESPNTSWEAVEEQESYGDYDGMPIQETALLDEEEWDEEEDEEYDNGEYEDEEEEEGAPITLNGLSPEEVQRLVGAWIDTQPDKKLVKKMGMGLVPKIMG